MGDKKNFYMLVARLILICYLLIVVKRVLNRHFARSSPVSQFTYFKYSNPNLNTSSQTSINALYNS